MSVPKVETDIKEIQIFSDKEEKKMREKRLKKTKPIIDALNAWRRDSLSSNIRF